MVSGILSPAFLQAAGRAGKKKSIIRFMCGEEADPTIQKIVCAGSITIESTKDGAPVSATYPAGTHNAIVVQADENTEVAITGNVTELYITKYNNDPDVDDYEGYMSLASIDVSGCKKLQTLCIAMNENVEALDLSTNTALQNLYCNGCTGLIEIKYPATNEDVSTAIAGAITAADAADGTVYTDSAAAYYSTIETAATDKGWTIEQIA